MVIKQKKTYTQFHRESSRVLCPQLDHLYNMQHKLHKDYQAQMSLQWEQKEAQWMQQFLVIWSRLLALSSAFVMWQLSPVFVLGKSKQTFHAYCPAFTGTMDFFFVIPRTKNVINVLHRCTVYFFLAILCRNNEKGSLAIRNMVYCSSANEVLGCTGQTVIIVGVSLRQMEKDTT